MVSLGTLAKGGKGNGGDGPVGRGSARISRLKIKRPVDPASVQSHHGISRSSSFTQSVAVVPVTLVFSPSELFFTLASHSGGFTVYLARGVFRNHINRVFEPLRDLWFVELYFTSREVTAVVV